MVSKEKKERVVVVAPVERLHNDAQKASCARIKALGLTAYGKNPKEAERQLRKMFAAYVELHRKTGTLETRLNKSKLEWCFESQYLGSKPPEEMLPDGTLRLIAPSSDVKIEDPVRTWEESDVLVVAR